MGTDHASKPDVLRRPAKVGLTLAEIVARLGGEAVGEVGQPLTGVATLDSAGPEHIAFLTNPRYRPRLATTRAGAVILSPADRDCGSMPRIVAANPYAYYARAVVLFNPVPPPTPGCHPSAQLAQSADVAASAEIGAFCVVGPDAVIADGAVIGAHCVIGAGTRIGANTRLYPRVTIYASCTIGARCVLHSGVVIGADGFGMAREGGHWVKIPQIGGVRIGDDVEVGANTTIDRGALDDTVIEEGVKLDNQIQIAHNCVIGAHTVIAGCTGISGSVTIGRDCMIGGGVGIVGHITIGSGITISGFTFVTKSLTEPGVYTSGTPAMPHAQWLKNSVHMRRLDEYVRRIRRKPGGDVL
ncbi:MAG: UDP-3-O-(3-hydroxymyristoyl)glucosamine N-acyltransferase [Usitatibacter sp.]